MSTTHIVERLKAAWVSLKAIPLVRAQTTHVILTKEEIAASIDVLGRNLRGILGLTKEEQNYTGILRQVAHADYEAFYQFITTSGQEYLCLAINGRFIAKVLQIDHLLDIDVDRTNNTITVGPKVTQTRKSFRDVVGGAQGKPSVEILKRTSRPPSPTAESSKVNHVVSKGSDGRAHAAPKRANLPQVNRAKNEKAHGGRPAQTNKSAPKNNKVKIPPPPDSVQNELIMTFTMHTTQKKAEVDDAANIKVSEEEPLQTKPAKPSTFPFALQQTTGLDWAD